MRILNKYFYPFAALAVLAFLQILFFLYADIKLILDIIPDDAAYYFKIAENFTKGFGFSFDTIHQTNGFQPLWQYILIIIYYIFPVEPHSFYRIVLIFQTLLIFSAGFLLLNSVRKTNDEETAVVSLSIFILLVFVQAVNGMESALVVLMLVLLYNYFARDSKTLNYFYAGILTGVLLLARLDLLFLPGIISLIFILRKEWKILLLFTAGSLLIILPYLVTNYIYTGHSGPISGILKSSFPEITLNLDLNYTLTGFITIIAALAAGVYYIIKNIKYLRDENFSIRKLILISLAGAVLIHHIFYLLFVKWPVLNYYFFFYGVFLALAAADILKIRMVRKTGIIILSGVMLFVILKDVSRLNKDLSGSWHAITYDAAVWTIENTPPEAVFAMKDAGNFSFLSKRKVINLDGLVNDFTFQDYLRDKKLNEYLNMNNVSYYVLYKSHAEDNLLYGNYDTYSESFMSYMYMRESDIISVQQQEEMYRKEFGHNSVFIIWKRN